MADEVRWKYLGKPPECGFFFFRSEDGSVGIVEEVDEVDAFIESRKAPKLVVNRHVPIEIFISDRDGSPQIQARLTADAMCQPGPQRFDILLNCRNLIWLIESRFIPHDNIVFEPPLTEFVYLLNLRLQDMLDKVKI